MEWIVLRYDRVVSGVVSFCQSAHDGVVLNFKLSIGSVKADGSLLIVFLHDVFEHHGWFLRQDERAGRLRMHVVQPVAHHLVSVCCHEGHDAVGHVEENSVHLWTDFVVVGSEEAARNAVVDVLGI